MSASAKINLGDAIFNGIEENPFLNELYDNILYNYALKKFELTSSRQSREVDIASALRFADLLSKSTCPQNKDKHKMWAQEIVVLLHELYPENEDVSMVAGSVLSYTGNYQGQKIIKSNYQAPSALERVFTEFQSHYLTIPAEPDLRFFGAQKNVYDHFDDPYFSYSGPTSMGKSFIMRMFMKEQVKQGATKNFALIVPTKALINENRSQIINDLKEYLQQRNYRVITAAGDLALEGRHNFILVLTPERLLYLLISKPDLQIDYVFIDEAHKLSGKNSRGPFYYKVVDMLIKRQHKPHIIFASPNIPNPEVYLRLLSEKTNANNRLRSTFSPVAQIKFLIDLNTHTISAYNDYAEELMHLATIQKSDATLIDFLRMFEVVNIKQIPENRQQTIVYCNGKSKAIELAREFSKFLPESGDKELDDLSRDIRNEVHGEYYLTEVIKKGVAYHIGYLPSAIRMRIEDMFRKGKITIMFCTSTLLEGVNLPADNLFITDFKINRSIMTPVDFRNLIGRVGRIRFNLYGNVFFVAQGDKITEKDYVELLQAPIPDQKLSIESGKTGLQEAEKKYIVSKLLAGDIEIEKRNTSQSEEAHTMMRKFALILLRDILENRNSLVRREFSALLTTADENKIRENFQESASLLDDDINISVDQAQNLSAAIEFGLKYPERVDGHFVYDDVLAFLEKLCRIFKWKKYEYTSLGKVSENGQFALLRWYAVILIQWMEGTGLSSIMKKAIEYRETHPDNFWLNKYQKTRYNGTTEHKNIVFADTLEVIENTILFSISNYFLRFSNEYKRIHQLTEFENNWYEFVEYGTTNPLTILLQRNGFSREVSTYIKSHQADFVVTIPSGELRLSRALLSCSNINACNEARDIQYNMPELFVADGCDIEI